MSVHVTSRAPVRVDAAGGGTDCPPYSVDHGGAVVNFCVKHYARASLEVLPDTTRVEIVSRDFNCAIEAVQVLDLAIDGELDLLKGIARRMRPEWGFRLTVSSDVPPGSGLGSSGAVSVAVVGLFDAAMQVTRSHTDTARLANEIERIDLGYPGGDQDSYGPALGGFNLLTYPVGGGTQVKKLTLSSETLAELESRALLVYTGEPHLSGSIHQDIKEGYAQADSPVVQAMHELKRIGFACAEALEQGDLDRFGRLLDENWQAHQRLHPSCNCEQLEKLYTALSGHVSGGKTCGAGGGGCILFLARPGETAWVQERAEALGGQVLPVKIDDEGLVIE
jgi:D-glycero-alpha-D-manno-heptose-7-phosphate kinase